MIRTAISTSAAPASQASADRARQVLPIIDDRALALDAAVVGIISVAICLASHQLVLMTVLVPTVLAARFVLWTRLERTRRGYGLVTEALLFAVCLGLGAFNDWNSVVRHRIYDYSVPAFAPSLTTIPAWMLLYWGMILLFLVKLTRWQRLGPPAEPDDRLRGRASPSPWLKIGLQLVLVLATRQAIYRLYDDPVWSWLPFALALGLWIALFRPTRHDAKLLALFAIGGPAIEILYIQAGDLHRYGLGWLGGVPLWIALWWLLAVLVWKDLSARLLGLLAPPGRA